MIVHSMDEPPFPIAIGLDAAKSDDDRGEVCDERELQPAGASNGISVAQINLGPALSDANGYNRCSQNG
jgi:hypothetical protein